MVEQLSRQGLYDLVWSEPVSNIAPRFGVSDVWFAKLCRAAEVPLPPRGHWAKLAHGKISERPVLPLPTDGTPEMVTIIGSGSEQSDARAQQKDQVQTEVAASPPIPVPRELRRPHLLVAATRTKAREALPQGDGRLHVGPAPGIFRLRVSRTALARSLRLLQAICHEAERRGWEVKPRSKTRFDEVVGGVIVIGRQSYPVSIEEQTEPVPFTEDDIRRWRAQSPTSRQNEEPSLRERRREPTGRLALILPSAWDQSRSRWTDNRRGDLEDHLVEFFATITGRAARDEERQQQWEQEEQERQERERLERIERARAKRLDEEILAAHRSNLIRDYVAKVRAHLDALTEARRAHLLAWCDWAESRADRLDPVTNLDLIEGFDDEGDRWGVARLAADSLADTNTRHSREA